MVIMRLINKKIFTGLFDFVLHEIELPENYSPEMEGRQVRMGTTDTIRQVEEKIGCHT